MKRGIPALVLLVLLVAGTLAVPVAFGQSTPGPFDLEDLQSSGTHPADAPEGVRYIGPQESPTGAAALRHTPADPLSSDPQFLQPGTTVNTNQIQLYSTIFGEGTGSYELVIVYWQPGQREIGNQTVDVAASQQVQRVSVDIASGYQTRDINLRPHYGKEWQATAWLEQNGERVEGAQWRFRHASIRSSQAVDISTQSDAWGFAARTVILPGIAAIVLGLTASKLVLRKTGRGPGIGMAAWGFMGLIGGIIAMTALWYEIAEVVAKLDILLGLSMGLVAFGGGLRMHEEPEKIRFLRKELTEATSLRGNSKRQAAREHNGDGDVATDGGEPDADGQDVVEIPEDSYQDELYEDEETLATLRRGGERVVVASGIRPFLGRLFGEPAVLNLSDLRTRVRVKSGNVAEKIFTSPDADEAVEHKPATATREWPVWRRVKDAELTTAERILFGALTVTVLALPVIGWFVADSMANVPLVGAVAGLVILGIESHTVEDGFINVEPAPRHFISADASLTILQDEFGDAKTLEEFERIAWEERSNTAIDAREIETRRDKTVIRRIAESELGIDMGVIDEPTDKVGGPDASMADDDRGEESSEARADGGDRDE